MFIYNEKPRVEHVVDGAGKAANEDRDAFHVPPGFKIEHLFSVPKNELGSWVSMAVDNKGRLIVSDQEGKGLCRVTPPPVHPHPGPLPEGEGEMARRRSNTSTRKSVRRKGCCTPSIVCTCRSTAVREAHFTGCATRRGTISSMKSSNSAIFTARPASMVRMRCGCRPMGNRFTWSAAITPIRRSMWRR